MNHTPMDRILIRAKDVALLIMFLTLGGMLWGMYKKPAQWDQTTMEMNTLLPRVDAIEKGQIANAERYAYIVKELDSIDRKIGR